MALKGVNLGGWLVIERWITPSLFTETPTASNEYQLAHSMAGAQAIRRHHETFIQEDDLAWLAAQGVQLLRVPVGYWIFGDEAPYVGAIERLDWLIAGARRHKLEVLLCLHAAPGAQNSEAHSGSGNQRRGGAWLRDKTAQQRTIEVLQRLAQRYNGDDLWGIELINEPAIDRFGLRLARFHRRAYQALTKVVQPGTRIVFSDGFRPWLTSGTFGWLKQRHFPVLMDSHLYYCFGLEATQRSFAQQLQAVRKNSRLLRALKFWQPVIVGEWSAVLHKKPEPTQTRQFAKAQHAAYQGAVAACYWTYKTEAPDRWNYRHMRENGLLA